MRLFELFKLKGKPAIIKCERFNGRGTIPTRAHVSDAGLDLYAPVNIILLCDAVHVVDTMIRVEIPTGYFGLILPRSSTSGRGVHVYTGVIDSGYRGTLKIQMSNILNHPVKGFKKGERIAQLVILPYLSAVPFDAQITTVTDRGNGGLGSTGR